MSGIRAQLLSSHSQLIQLNLPVDTKDNTDFKWEDQPQLRYARHIAMETFTAEDIAQSPIDGTPVISNAQLLKCSLTLETNDPDSGEDRANLAKWKTTNKSFAGRYRDTQQNQQYIPLAALHRVQNAGPGPFVRDLFFMYNTYVTWQKSKLYTRPALANESAVCVLILVYYSWLDIDGIPIQRT